MLPHFHFLIAALIISPITAVLFPEKDIFAIGEWVIMGGILSAAIDLDIICSGAPELRTRG